MAASIDICNQALSLVGAGHITSINDGTNEAKQCKIHYNPCLRKILTERQWTFATARMQLSQSSNAPAFSYTNSFTLPPDCVLVRSVSDASGRQYADWIVEGRAVSLNEADCYITYTKMEYDTTKYTGPFEAAMVYLLASRLAISIANSRSLAQDNYGLYQMELSQASGLDGGQGTPTVIGSNSSRLIAARTR